MRNQTLMYVIGALLLAGFTATVAEAGEARRSSKRPAVKEEDETGRKPGRTGLTRTGPTALPTRRTPARAPETRRPTARVPETRRPAARGTVVRKPVERGPRVQRPAHRGPRVVPGHLHPRPAVRRPVLVWVPGRFEDHVHQVWVPGHYRTKHIPARYEKRRGWFGLTWRVLVKPARTERVWVAGHYRAETRRIWIQGHWARRPASHGGHRPHR